MRLDRLVMQSLWFGLRTQRLVFRGLGQELHRSLGILEGYWEWRRRRVLRPERNPMD